MGTRDSAKPEVSNPNEHSLLGLAEGEEREHNLQGFALGVFRIGSTMDSILADHTPGKTKDYDMVVLIKSLIDELPIHPFERQTQLAVKRVYALVTQRVTYS